MNTSQARFNLLYPPEQWGHGCTSQEQEVFFAPGQYIQYNCTTLYTVLPEEFTEGYYDNIRYRNYGNFLVNTIATSIAVWVIVYKSPVAMGTYRWFLLNIAVRLV